MNKSKICITGATGLLGTSLYHFLKSNSYDVIGHGFSGGADYNADLKCPEQTHKMLDKISPNLIVNLVALTDVDRCEVEPNEAYLLNVKTIENIVLWIKQNPLTHLIHLSTDQVYDGGGPHKENEVSIKNVYAFSKYCSEVVATKINSTVIRTNFFGKSLVNKQSFSDWLINSFKARTPMKLFTDICFSPLSMGTLIGVIEKIIIEPITGIFNVGSHFGLSKRDFAVNLAKELSLKTDNATDCLRDEFNFTAYRPYDMRMDCSLFEMTYKYKLPDLNDEIIKIARST